MYRRELQSSDSDEDEVLYSEDEPRQSSESRSSSEESDEEWNMNWNDLECVDECGEDEDKDTPRKLSDSSSDEELNDLELDAVDELNEQSCEKSNGVERERERSEEDKNDEEKEGDPWSRWVGGDHEKKERREEEKSEEKKERREETREKRDEHRRDEKREYSRREEGKPTLAELVLTGRVSGGAATRDRRSRAVRSSPPRRASLARKSPPRRDRPATSPARRHEADRKAQRNSSPLRRHPPSPVRKERRSPSPPIGDRRRERSPHRRVPSPSLDRRRNGSPVRRERRPSPPDREGRSCERRGEASRSERSSLLPNKYSLPRLSSPNRTMLTRGRSPVTGKRDRDTLPKVSSPNRVKIGERTLMRRESPSRREEREERRRDRSRSPLLTHRRDLPSLLDVNIPPPIHPMSSRMEGRVKRDAKMEETEKREERPKERIGRDARDTREEKKEERTETREVMEKKEERKRHIPIVWNDKESDAMKKYRSVVPVKGMDMVVRKESGVERRETMKEETKKEKSIAALIPSSMMARIGKCSLGSGPGVAVRPHKFEVQPKESVDSLPPSVSSLHKGQGAHKIIEPVHPHLRPTEVVRIIRNDEVAIGQRKEAVEERSDEDEEEEEEEGEYEEGEAHGGMDEDQYEDESGWLSATLQQDASGLSMDERMEKRKADPSSAALRLFGRAAASAASSSTLKDARPTISTGGRVTRETPNTIEEQTGGRRRNRKNRKKTEGIFEMRPSPNKKSVQKRRRQVSQSGPPRLLEAYY